jgi:PAS domain S-box-containing protein
MTTSLNKLLGINIQAKLAIAFTGLSIVPLLLIGLYGIHVNSESLKEKALEDLAHHVSTIQESVRHFLSGSRSDMRFLSGSYPFRELMAAREAGDPAAAGRIRGEVEKYFISFAQSREIYYRLRFIDAGGEELLRVVRDGGGYRAVPEGELGEGGNRFYSLLVRDLAPGQSAFAPVELDDREAGVLIPAISHAYPVFDDSGRMAGILVADIYAERFFAVFDKGTGPEPPGEVVLVSSDGYYLYHSERKKDWNRLLASRDASNLHHDYPGDVASKIVSGGEGTIEEGLENIIVYASLFPGHSDLRNAYALFESIPTRIIFAPVESFKKVFVTLLLFFLAAAIVLSYFAAHQFTEPIRTLQKGAERIASGHFEDRLEIETRDEIEMLAEQFNRMAGSIAEREREIERHRDRLEELVAARTEELSRERDKLRTILDNVPSAFLVLDRDLRILSASAAYHSLTGKAVEEVIGQSCEESLCGHFGGMTCPTRRSLESGAMETEVLTRGDGTGGTRHIECVSIPVRRNGAVNSVIEIITDITNRKRLEEQLVRSEKFASTGEMAAVIAHEIRNSVTSIKLTLQLLAENPSIESSDLESLRISLQSIDRMEELVTSLLKFAGPAELECEPSDIHRVLRESVAFTRPQYEARRIRMKTDFQGPKGLLMLDPDRLKEAFINLILNASQAIESGGEIRITVRGVRVDRAVRNLRDAKPGEQGTEVRFEPGDPAVEVRVEDTGCGIPPHDLERIFDPFYSTKLAGTGLGLSLVKRIVNQHHGVIRAESDGPGKGSRFIVLLPDRPV